MSETEERDGRPDGVDESDASGRGVRWRFTLNNYTAVETMAIQSELVEHCRYIIYGRETAPTTGTKHLQGYLELRKRRSLKQLSGMPGLGRASLFRADASAAANEKYASKEDPEPWTYGVPAKPCHVSGGESTKRKFDVAYELAREGRLDEIDRGILIRHRTALNEIAADAVWKRAAARVCVPEITLRPWQQRVLDILGQPADDRSIHFVVDPKGNLGKSTFCRWLCAKLTSRLPSDGGGDSATGRKCDVQILTPGRSVDLARFVKPADAYLLDVPRDDNAYIPWGLLEMLKNGYVVSTKYDPVPKSQPPPHIIVLTNNPVPDFVLSADRIKLISIAE